MAESYRHVVYLTGAPAAGKSSVAAALKRLVPELQAFDYGQHLRARVARRVGREVSYDELRGLSASIVTPADVAGMDEDLIAWAGDQRKAAHVLIDTHAVTREEYGFRATPYSLDQVQRLRPSLIFCLFVTPSVTRDRIAADPAGRPAVSEFEAGLHVGLQGSVALTYGIALGAPVFFLDSSRRTEEVAQHIADQILR